MHCKLPRHPVQNLFLRSVHHRRSSTDKSFLAIISPSLRPHRIGKEFALANRIVHLLKNKIMKKILVGIWDFLSMVHKFSLIFFVKVDFFLGNHLAFTTPASNWQRVCSGQSHCSFAEKNISWDMRFSIYGSLFLLNLFFKVILFDRK